MIEIAAALEATPLAQFLKQSRWVYPLVNAGHILGLALLVGAVVPMDLRILGALREPGEAATVSLLRPVSAAGLALAVACGLLLFVTQASDYVQNWWFRAKIAVVAVAALNAAVHLRLERYAVGRKRAAALLSLSLWPTALVLGRMIGFS